MRDPIEMLSSLEPGSESHLPSAAEIRRRGDARRRRRLAGVGATAALALVAVAVIPSLLIGEFMPHDPATGPTGVTTAPSPSGTEIPDDFSLADGLPDENGDVRLGPAAPQVLGTDLPDLELCGQTIWPAGGVESLAVVVDGSQRLIWRELTTYSSPDEAVAVLGAARDAISGCVDADGRTLESFENLTGYDDATYAIYSPASDAVDAVQLVRVGSAVLVSSVSGTFPEAADAATAGVDEVTASTAAVAPHMCVFTDDGCSGPATSPTEAACEDCIPADFPLLRHVPVGPDDDVVGADWEYAGVALCGQRVWPVDEYPGFTEGFGLQVVGPEGGEVRWLANFGDSELAAAALEAANLAVGACTLTPYADGGPAELEVVPLVGETGHENVTFAAVDPEAPAGTVYQIMQVGHALLYSSTSGEYTAGSAQQAAADLSEQSADLATEMCVFTEDGC